jgi:hypothetical protein
MKNSTTSSSLSLCDIRQICPKFVVFKGQLSDGSVYRQVGEIAFAPSKSVPLLQQLSVTCVVRLNEPADPYDRSAHYLISYSCMLDKTILPFVQHHHNLEPGLSTAHSRSEFESVGILHHDLYFDDCTVPRDATVHAS